MHINAKRMKRRIDKAQEINREKAPDPLRISGQDDEEAITEASSKPEYLKITDYKKRAKLLGLTIREAAGAGGGTVYHIAGQLLDELEEYTRDYSGADDLKAAINSIWDTVTEPELEGWIDESGRLHERLAYPEPPLF